MGNRDIDKILASYPKERPPLPEFHLKIYAEEYKKTRGDRKNMPTVSKISSGFNSWIHDKVAQTNGKKILEIGAGTLNHISFEKNIKDYDIVEPFRYLFADNQNLSKVRTVYDDIRDVSPDNKYDKILSIHVLEHLTELPFAVAKSGTLLQENGKFYAGIPSEGGLMWKAAWKLTTGLAYHIRNGRGKAAVMKHEHVNNAYEIEAVLKHFFDDVKVQRYPFNTVNTSIFTYLEASGPKIELCKEYCDQYLARQESIPHEQTQVTWNASTHADTEMSLAAIKTVNNPEKSVILE